MRSDFSLNNCYAPSNSILIIMHAAAGQEETNKITNDIDIVDAHNSSKKRENQTKPNVCTTSCNTTPTTYPYCIKLSERAACACF